MGAPSCKACLKIGYPTPRSWTHRLTPWAGPNRRNPWPCALLRSGFPWSWGYPKLAGWFINVYNGKSQSEMDDFWSTTILGTPHVVNPILYTKLAITIPKIIIFMDINGLDSNHPPMFFLHWSKATWYFTLLLFNIAMENFPFIDGLPFKNGDFPLAMWNNQMVITNGLSQLTRWIDWEWSGCNSLVQQAVHAWFNHTEPQLIYQINQWLNNRSSITLHTFRQSKHGNEHGWTRSIYICFAH